MALASEKSGRGGGFLLETGKEGPSVALLMQPSGPVDSSVQQGGRGPPQSLRLSCAVQLVALRKLARHFIADFLSARGLEAKAPLPTTHFTPSAGPVAWRAARGACASAGRDFPPSLPPSQARCRLLSGNCRQHRRWPLGAAQSYARLARPPLTAFKRAHQGLPNIDTNSIFFRFLVVPSPNRPAWPSDPSQLIGITCAAGLARLLGCRLRRASLPSSPPPQAGRGRANVAAARRWLGRPASWPRSGKGQGIDPKRRFKGSSILI